MKVLYDWLKDYVGDECPSVEDLDALFTFHAFEIDGIERVGKHDVIDVKVLPDRSSDCLSHRGIARELSTLIGKPLAHDSLTQSISLEPKTDKIKVTIEDSENCRRFAAARITGVTVKASPDWLKERLEALGQRSINNVVDATNYVMLALGQPLHAYDAHTFEAKDGVWQFGVRMSREGERVTTLSGDTLTLPEGVQLIVNGGTDTPVGIAGIKGGKSAGITEATTTIILEAANFNPQVTRRGTQKTRLQTDASKRFENNLSPELVAYGLKECVDLILKIAGGTCEGFIDEYLTKKDNAAVTVDLARINALLGFQLTPDDVDDILKRRLGFTCGYSEETWWVLAPFERTDIVIPEDVIAEVGRVHGYDHVESILPECVPLSEINTKQFYTDKIRNILIEEGFSEVITSSFRKNDQIELANALASDKRFLRSSLRQNVQEVLLKNITNIDLLGIPFVQVFEIGTVFEKTSDGTDVTEHVSLAVGVRTKQQGYTPKDDDRLTEVLRIVEEGLGMSLEVQRGEGVLECNVSALLSGLPPPLKYDLYEVQEPIQFVPYSSYPHISRDIALWVPSIMVNTNIQELLREKAGPLLVRISLFDSFKKDDQISYAFRLVFQAPDRTLTDAEVGAIMDNISAEAMAHGLTVR